MSRSISGRTLVAGVAGAPVTHSLSPVIQNHWIAGAGLDAVYVPFRPPLDGFADFVAGLRGGAIRGLNVTAPFKEDALAAADTVSDRARRAGAANLLVFGEDGMVFADNTDGAGLLGAFAEQAPSFRPAAGPVVVLGAGGAARGAAAAFLEAGAPQVRVVNRHRPRAEGLAEVFGADLIPYGWDDIAAAFDGAGAVVNATPAGLNGATAPVIPYEALPAAAVVMDMVYRPIRTAILEAAAARGLATVDGLAMLIGQAVPSFAAFFGRPPPASDVRAVAIAQLESQT